MRKLKYLSLIGGLLLAMTSCDDNEPQSFNAEDTFVSFPNATASIDENATEPIKIPIVLAGLPNGETVTVNISAITTGESSPAIEGVDFIIKNKKIVFEGGYGTQNIEVEAIDNDLFTGKKTFNLVITSSTPILKETPQNSVKVSIIDDEHPWAAIIGTYNIVGFSGFDGTDLSIPVVISASDDDVNVLNLNFGYGTLAEMNVEEDEGEIKISIKDNQYIGPTPKPTDNWNRYFRATHLNGDDLYILNALTGSFEDGIITCEAGLGFEAIHPTTGESGGYFTLFDDGIVFNKVK
ncbi:Calx-beta domain-containing protein [Bacteroides salyersiae]|jgi:hypothetical protein|uniref:Calx-beta domain-containing protein n=1 Tax=Bacteroides salyersiae TaxID=291644 RepID=UPI001C8B91B7|nr:Calx-beta domain-containing protein [Bacteroides salyersiae]